MAKKKIHYLRYCLGRQILACSVVRVPSPTAERTTYTDKVTCLRCLDYLASRQLKGYKHR